MQVAALFARVKGCIFQTEGYCELSLRLLIRRLVAILRPLHGTGIDLGPLQFRAMVSN